MANCQTLIRENLSTIIQNSGHNLQDYGQYYQCIELKPNFTYFSLDLSTKIGNHSYIQVVRTGLCLPSICTPSLIKQQANQMMHTMNVSATVTRVSILNSLEKLPHLSSFDATVNLCIFLIVLLLLSTFLYYWKQASIFSIFSLQQSKKYFNRNPNNKLNVFNGIKSLCLMWIIIFHYFRSGSLNSINRLDLQKLHQSPFFLLAQRRAIGVAVFFYMGGFLTSYVVIKQMFKSNWTCFINILHRALRILPTFLFVLLVYFNFYPQISEGLLWKGDKNLQSKCFPTWKVWTFTDNFYNNGANQCYLIAWYLDVDMQLYAISMMILLIYKYFPRISKITIGVTSAIGIYQNYIYLQQNKIPLIVHFYDSRYTKNYDIDQYMKPWQWIPTYFFGLLIGMLYYQYVQQKRQSQNSSLRRRILSKLQLILKQKKFIRIGTEVAGIAIMLYCLYIPRSLQNNQIWPQLYHSLYISCTFSIFVLGLTLMILPSILGCRSFISFILDTNFFNFISKISFGAYLIHYMYVWTEQRGTTTTYYYTLKYKFVKFVAITILSLFTSFFITISVQIPCGTIHRKILSCLRSGSSSQQMVRGEKKRIQGMSSKSNINNNQIRENHKKLEFVQNPNFSVGTIQNSISDQRDLLVVEANNQNR